MNQPNPVAAVTNQATKEALIARQEFELTEQREVVADLRRQVEDRLRSLMRLAREVEEVPERYHGGAFGHDTETIDDLLRALAQEAKSLRNMEAAAEHGQRLTAKFEEQLADLMAKPPSQPEAIPMGAGQYL